MRAMDPLVLARLVPAWREELLGSQFAGIRPRADGLELVFDRAPEGPRPGRRSALCVRLAPPVWVWTEPAVQGAEWAFRLPGGALLTGLQQAERDRRLVLEFSSGHRAHLELWPPGNVLFEEADVRLVWCARTRAASAFRPALAPGVPYAPPSAPLPLDFSSWTPESSDLARLARDFAGLPKGLLEALAPTLPREWSAESLAAWAHESYGEAPPVRAYAWTWPSPGATLLTRALLVDPGGPRFVGSYGSWTEAARMLGRSLPAPVDLVRVAAAKGTLRRLERAHAAVTAEIAEASDASALRSRANALAAFLPRVPKGAAQVELPDPSDPSRTLTIALDPKLKPHENVDRLFKRAGKLERVAAQAPARLEEIARQLLRARAALEAAERGEPEPPRARRAGAAAPVAEPKKARVPSALEPRRYRTSEGWEVMIGKSNLGNDHLTHRLARSEDYWMHVHGAAGSHVVLRRGKGPNEPSKATLEEVAGWAAFYSQARNAGTVPVTVTQKKYVSKPRKAPAGLAHVTRSKTVFARPTEPPDSAREDNA
jgi:hypothetical protein